MIPRSCPKCKVYMDGTVRDGTDKKKPGKVQYVCPKCGRRESQSL